MYEVHASYRYNRSKAKILHRIKLNNVIWADIFSFSYKIPATDPISIRQQHAYYD